MEKSLCPGVWAMASGLLLVGLMACGGGSSSPAPAAATVAAPAAPTAVNAVPGDQKVTLSWTGSSGATSYSVQRSTTSGGPYVQSGTVTAPTTSFVDVGLVDGTTYDYVVTALNGSAKSAASAEVAATPSASAVPVPLVSNPRVGLGTWFSNDWDTSSAFVDVFKQSRTWQNAQWNAPASVDANGWPTEDASTVLATYPHFVFATYKLIFNGSATVSPNWFAGTVTNMVYDSGSNTSTADVNVTGQGSGYINLVFTNTRRTASSAAGTGFTNARLYRPGYPTDGSVVFTAPFLAAMGQVSTVRMMDWTSTNGNYVVNWADRTTPETATQDGLANSWTGPDNTVYNGTGGVALEYQIMLANALNADCYINIPMVASDDFVTKMAQAIAFGTDGTTPYTSVQASPAFPPLNPNLRVYLEYANEVWNSAAGVFGPVKSICQNLPANHPLLTVAYDPASIGIYQQMWRYPAWRMATISQIFKGVFGADSMMTRVRPLLETQQGDAQQTLDLALQWLDAYATTYLNPATTASGLIYGGGGSAYYGVIDSSSAAVDSIFAPANYPDPGFLDNWATDSMWLSNYGLKHVAYEGGPGINSAFSDAANRLINADPRMTTMMEAYQTGWEQMGGDLLIYYTVAGPSPWEFTSDITNLSTPKFTALADIQATPKAAVTLGASLPGTLAGADASGVNALAISTGNGYDVTIGAATCNYIGGAGGHFRAYPAHAASAFTGTLTLSGCGGYSTVATGMVPVTVAIWINGVQQGTVTLAAQPSLMLATSTALQVNLPAGLSVIRLQPTADMFFGSLTVTD
jgi:hypothetical protein